MIVVSEYFSLISLIIFLTSVAACESRLAVGSSSNIIFAPLIKVRATPILTFSPPDKFLTSSSNPPTLSLFFRHQFLHLTTTKDFHAKSCPQKFADFGCSKTLLNKQILFHIF